MKKQLLLLAAAFIGGSLLTAQAQFGGGHGSGGPNFGAATARLFGEHQTFSATLEFEMAGGPAGQTLTMPGKISFDNGKSRFEMNMTEMKGLTMPPQAIDQMKTMGMDQMVSIAIPDKKLVYIIYPGMQSYVENPSAEKAAAADDFKVVATELGQETADGHDCVKNKVVVTDKDGKNYESTVWNATDLRNFPVKIETTEQGHKAVMHFKDVSFSKPEASAFVPPAAFKKYSSMQAMIQEVMMKKMGGAMPPH